MSRIDNKLEAKRVSGRWVLTVRFSDDYSVVFDSAAVVVVVVVAGTIIINRRGCRIFSLGLLGQCAIDVTYHPDLKLPVGTYLMDPH
jgi:hypothetical protein